MPETIKASEQNLDKIFCDDYLFEIPEFQRPYAWTTEQVDDLLDDLLFAMRRDMEEPYFLGSIVLIKGDEPKSQVVDGQQRLTTLTMLLCTLRELAEGEVKSALDQRIRQQRDVLAGIQEVVRLGLRNLDQEFFYQNVQATGGIGAFLDNIPLRETDSQQRIFENVKYLYERLAELDPGERAELAGFIIRQCYLVVVSTSDMTSAYRIFSVMNDRGLDLSATDILKAEIIGGLSDADERRSYADKWEDIEQELGRDRFGALFTHVRTIYAKAKQRRSLQEEFREHVLSRYDSKEFIDKVLDQYDDVYKRILGLTGEGGDGTQKFGAYLRHLRRLDNVDWIPPALAFFYRYPGNPDALGKFTKSLERLAYGLFIRRANINERINRYAAVLRDIEQGDTVWRDEAALQLHADEKTAILQILDGPIYTLPRVPGPLLLRLDSLLAGAGASYDYSVISIEHVLPQSPAKGSQWLNWFPDDEERKFWTHRLANLVLLSSRKNTRASNLEFGRKKTEYFQRGGVSPFAVTTQVVAKDEWTPAILEHRQKELVDSLKEEWLLE